MFKDSKPYIKADELKNGDLIKFTDEGIEVQSTKFFYPELTMAGKPHPRAGEPKVQFEIGIELSDGTPKKLTLNSTSYKALSGKWGHETLNWIDKAAKVSLIPLPTGKTMISLEALD